MNKVRKVFKYIFLGLGVITSSILIYESCLDSKTSQEHSDWFANTLSKFLNNALGLKQKAEDIKAESISLHQSNYAYNKIEGYEKEEIPLGCSKQLTATVQPDNTLNKNVYYVATPADSVNISQSGNSVTVEGLKTGNVEIKAISRSTESVTAFYNFNIVDLKAPNDFSIEETIEIPLGLTKYLDLTVLSQVLKNDQLLTCRYFDKSKLVYLFDDNSIASISDNFITGTQVGSTTLKVSNGTISKNITINVVENLSPIVNPTTFSIVGNNSCFIGDMDFDRTEKGLHNTPLSIDWGDNEPSDKNVIWSVDNPMVARIDEKGVVRGYRKTSEEDVEFTVTATSVADKNKFATFKMFSRHVMPTALKITPTLQANENGTYGVAAGKSITFNVSYEPSNVTKKGINIESNNNEIVKVNNNGSSITIIGLKPGDINLNIKAKYNENLNETISINCFELPIINPGNRYDFGIEVRKYFGGHALLFALTSLFIGLFFLLTFFDSKYLVLKFIGGLFSIGYCFVLALLTEFCQLFAPGRTASMNDVGLDMVGACIGIVAIVITIIVLLIIFLVKLIKYRKRNSILI